MVLCLLVHKILGTNTEYEVPIFSKFLNTNLQNQFNRSKRTFPKILSACLAIYYIDIQGMFVTLCHK